MSNYLAAPQTVKDMMEKYKGSLQQALPRHISVDKIIRIAVTQLTKNPMLQQCSQTSFFGSVLESAFYGLEPDGREAALIPFRIKGQMTCTFQPMYRGLLKLARNSGDLAVIFAEVVHEGEEFILERGMNPNLVHKPSIGKVGKPIGAYAVYKLKSGESDFTWMNLEQIKKIQARSKAKNSPWSTDWEEMAKKTVIKRVLKVAPSSVEKMTDNPESADVIFKGLEALELPTPDQEAEGAILAPETIEPAVSVNGSADEVLTNSEPNAVETAVAEHVAEQKSPHEEPSVQVGDSAGGVDLASSTPQSDVPFPETAQAAPNPDDFLKGVQ